MFLKTVSEEDAAGRIAELYQAQKAQNGFVMSRCSAGLLALISCPSIRNSPIKFDLGSR
jgi:hypothetical protein